MAEAVESVSLEEIGAFMESRANVYKVLSRAFGSEVDAVFAAELADEFSLVGTPALEESLAGMKAALSGADEVAIEQLAVEFDRVFYGMGPLTARHAFPYESVYTSDRGIMMQEAHGQVVRVLREQQLAKDPAFKEPEDHLAVELAFMATLADRAAALLREGDEAAATEAVAQQRDFLQEHLLNWVDRFCVDLKTAVGEGFYAHLAQFTAAFLADDGQLLDEMLED